jgi:hypothetical protein
MDLEFAFSAEVYKYQGKTAWFFVTLPQDKTNSIRFFHERRLGFGTIRVNVTIGDTSWNTSMFPDKKSGSFLLPIKASVRSKHSIDAGKTVSIRIRIIA